jgi:hypothetical protein
MNLRCTGAGATSADLAWDASSAAGITAYVVERAPVEGGDFAPLPAGEQPLVLTYSDESMAVGAAYRFRVRARVGDQLGDASNVVTVGAPQPGFSVIAPAPTSEPERYGMNVDLALDPNGDPAVAFVHADPNGDSDPGDSKILFVRWDRANYTWTEVTEVTTNVAPGTTVTPSIALSIDASGGAWIAFGDGLWTNLRIASLPAGAANWQTSTVQSGADAATFMSVDFVATGSTGHLLFSGNGHELAYATGALSAGAASWTVTDVPAAGPTDGDPHIGLPAASLAVDSAGGVGVGYVTTSATTSIASFWRPGGSAEVAFDSGAFVGDGLSVGLAFAGSDPVLAATLPTSFEPEDPSMAFARKTGSNWSTRTTVPFDGSVYAGAATQVAVSGTEFAIIYDSTSGAGGNVCGNPKLSRSSDGTSWTTCSPDTNNSRGDVTLYSRVAPTGAGDFYAAWQTWASESPARVGVTFWRGE